MHVEQTRDSHAICVVPDASSWSYGWRSTTPGGANRHGIPARTKRRRGRAEVSHAGELASIGDDFWIEDEEGVRAYRVNGKAIRARETFVLEDTSGNEVAQIQERKLSVRDKVAIERDGDTIATVHKALVGIRDRFAIDVEAGSDLKAHGNIVDHEYEIERDGDSVARISKRWFRCATPTASKSMRVRTRRSCSQPWSRWSRSRSERLVATLKADPHFGRILAAYGGVFVAGSLAWGMAFDGFGPDRYDVIGAFICLVGVGVIMFSPRT